MRVIKEIFSPLIILIVLIPLGIIGGFLIGLRIESPPTLTSWEALNNPVKFTEIVNVSYADGEIGAKGFDGKLYYWGCMDQTCDQWHEVLTLPHDHKKPGLPIKKLRSCPKNNPPDYNFPTKEPPGIIIQCVFQYTRSGPGFTGTYIALLEDGKLWSWHPQNTATDMPILSLFIGPALGGLLGILASGILIYLQTRKR